jgi:CubicO group peptidase (beta-lactamase class C family)
MNISSADVLNKMRLVRPSYSLRSGFIYQNIFYIAAGAVIEKVSGQPWDTFMKTRLFQPLKMNRTFPKLKEVKDVNQSSPHFIIENKITVIERTNADEIGSAGSVWSCADDMAKWAIAMLDSGKYEGGRLLKANTWSELFKPQVIAPASFYPTTKLTKPNWTTYAFGWYQQDYKGRKTNYHTGSLAGEVAIHGQLPSERLAIYVFGNLDHAEVRHALLFKAFDHFALGGTTDWSSEFKTLYTTTDEQTEKREKDFESKRVMGTVPSHPLSAYSGKYTDPLFGELEVVVSGTSLNLVINNKTKATLTHWHYDTFRGWCDKKWYGKVNAVFTADANGKITRVTVAGMEFRR